LTSIRVVAAALTALLLPGAAAAQGTGPWFFCYVDPPTFNSGSYVYTQVNYVGGAAIPQAEIAAAMVAANPQVAGRQLSCWRYSTREEAEQRRQKGMALDRGRNYAIREIGWTSPYTPENAPAEIAEPVQAEPTPSQPASAQSASSAGAGEAKSAEVSRVLPPKPKPASDADERYAREMAEYLRKKAENERQQAEYVRSLQSHQKHVEDVAERTEQAKRDYDERRAQWMNDVEACKAGDHSKCAQAPE
jgi:hypothetical protein